MVEAKQQALDAVPPPLETVGGLAARGRKASGVGERAAVGEQLGADQLLPKL